MPCPSDHPANLLLPQAREIDPTDGVKEHEKKKKVFYADMIVYLVFSWR